MWRFCPCSCTWYGPVHDRIGWPGAFPFALAPDLLVDTGMEAYASVCYMVLNNIVPSLSNGDGVMV